MPRLPLCLSIPLFFAFACACAHAADKVQPAAGPQTSTNAPHFFPIAGVPADDAPPSGAKGGRSALGEIDWSKRRVQDRTPRDDEVRAIREQQDEEDRLRRKKRGKETSDPDTAPSGSPLHQ